MIKVTAYTNPESIVINSLRDLAATTTEDGWKVVLRFRDENEMKALQDALNYRFPENMRTMQEMPTEEGYYITQTGTLLYRDGAQGIGVCAVPLLMTESMVLSRLERWIIRVACYMASCCLDVWCCGVPASASQVCLLIMILIMPADLFRRAFSFSGVSYSTMLYYVITNR